MLWAGGSAPATGLCDHTRMTSTSRRRELQTALNLLAPRIPRFEFEAVVDHAEMSIGLQRAYPETAIWLSLVATVRHLCTDYDALLEDGYDVESARHFVLEETNEILADWGAKRRVSGEEDEV